MKRSQMRMGETIAILLIFFMLLIFGLFFYIKVQRTSAERTFEKQADISSIEIVQRASTLPELQCSSGNDVEDNCIDIYKAAILKQKIDETQTTTYNPSFQQHYVDLFSLSEIKLKLIYPNKPSTDIGQFSNDDFIKNLWKDKDGGTTDAKDTFILYENPSDPEEQRKFTQSRTNVPISLYNPLGNGICAGLRGSCAFGMMEITVFSRK